MRGEGGSCGVSANECKLWISNSIIKGTVRPDWICMRVVSLKSPLKGHQPLDVFDFLISVLNIWNNSKVLSRFMQNWAQSPACSVQGLHRMLYSYWLAHFHLMKKSAKVQLYFGSGCRMLKFFTSEPQSKEQLMPLPHLWNTVWRKRSRLEHIQTVNRGLFAWSGWELWSCFKNSRSKIKNWKHIAVDVLLKGFSMIPLSCRSNLAGRYL